MMPVSRVPVPSITMARRMFPSMLVAWEASAVRAINSNKILCFSLYQPQLKSVSCPEGLTRIQRRYILTLKKWSGRDLNPHAVKRRIPSTRCLPFSSPDQMCGLLRQGGAPSYSQHNRQSSEDCLLSVLVNTSGGGILITSLHRTRVHVKILVRKPLRILVFLSSRRFGDIISVTAFF